MHDLTEILLTQTLHDDAHDADPDLMAGLLASLLKSEAARRGQAYCNVALFALVLRSSYPSHSAALPVAPNRRRGAQITRSLRHLVREYAAQCGLPDHMLDEALAFSARIWNVLHPPHENP